MDATLAGTVDVFGTTENTRPPHSQNDMMMDWDDDDVSHSTWKTCVRDASWHPNAPVIAGRFTNSNTVGIGR
jgi:WD repeat-containing protein 23